MTGQTRPDQLAGYQVNANDLVAFLVELVAFVLIGTWGYRAGGPAWAKVGLAIGLVLLAATAWGMFAAPRARFRIPWVTLLVKVVVLGAAVAAGFTILPLAWAVAFAAVVVLNLLLLYVGPFARHG
ncbi:YrdB family protein [Intrasporangium sp.]|uniref:YrdB family protein n=1 Tax=Intrasporangium sp. TaxID=1925024 RepID=UPI00293AF61A|nr:YrdB family protein [Intrasporangium sp.]MDV3223415.1 YrdB family protein [Intrasporangium sp.]